MKYTFKNVRKAVVATVAALATGLGAMAAAFADYPEIASGVIVAGSIATAVSTFFVKNEKVIDEFVGTQDELWGNE